MLRNILKNICELASLAIFVFMIGVWTSGAGAALPV